MEAEVNLLTRRGAAVMRRAHRVSADRVRFGRGTNNEVPMPDIRVELTAASLSLPDGRLMIETAGSSPLRVNGRTVESAPVGPGDEIVIGPYQILVTEPPEGCDAAFSVELVQPLGNTLNTLVSGARIGMASAAPSKRTMSWAGFVVIAALLLIAPIVVYAVGLVPSWRDRAPHPGAAGIVALSWNAGQLSNPHRPFATDCAACHRASFSAVPDAACLTCHTGVGAHAEAKADLAGMRKDLNERRCTTCHEEHRGLRGLVIQEASLCLDCHRDLTATAPGAKLEDVAGFPTGHPQFRATLVADAGKNELVRRELGTTPAPKDNPGLHFSHVAHLLKGGYPKLGYKELTCADCHKPEPSGQGFMPITYAGQCQSCHALKFERTDLPWPDATVPHGDDSGIVAAVWNYYAGKAIQGATGTSQNPPPPPVTREAAGVPPPPPPASPAKDVQGWVAARSESALRNVILDDKRGCAYCHYGTGANGAFEPEKFLPSPMAPAATARVRIVAPVLMETRFLPKARFDHAKHTASTCDDCHNSRTSETSADVLIPDEKNCVRCHGSENAALRTQSTCVTCHAFHHPEFGAMRKEAAAVH